MSRVIGKRTTKKGKLDPTRWGWKAVSFFDGQDACIPGFPKGGIFRKHLFDGKGACRRCSRHLGQK